MPKEQWQTRLDSDMADRVEEYQDEHNLTSAEAVRRLVATGLDAQEQPTREEIAADLNEIDESVSDVADDLDDLRADLDDTDGSGDGELQRAAQTGTVVMVAVVALAALVGTFILQVLPLMTVAV